MDLFYLIIIIVALAVFFLDRSHSIIAPPTETKKENFSDFPSESLGVDYSAPSPDPEASQGATNIKFGGTPRWGSAFSKFGPTPPNPRCNITVMGENCSNYNYDTTTNSFQSVCQKSVNTYPNKLFPDYVMGRSLTRVRQCNNLISP
jgi:hypothetical protein